MSRRKSWHARHWLNPKGHGDTGYILAEVEPGWRQGATSATLRVADCNRIVSLDFDYHSEASRRQRLAKIDQIIAVLETMKVKMVELERTEDEPER